MVRTPDAGVPLRGSAATPGRVPGSAETRTAGAA